MKQPFSLKVVTTLHCPLHFSYGQALDQVSCLFLYESSCLDQVSCLFLYESSCLYLYESCYGLSSRLESIFDMLFQIIELHDESLFYMSYIDRYLFHCSGTKLLSPFMDGPEPPDITYLSTGKRPL